MAIELKVPAVGESITEVEIGDWLKAKGDTVQKDEPVVTLESEKATVELPAPISGTISDVLKKKGDTAAIGEVIAYIEKNGEADAPAKPAEPKEAPGKESEQPRGVMPAAERVLAEQRLRAEEIQPTGPGGRVLKEDVLREVEERVTPKETAHPPARAVSDTLPQPAPPSPQAPVGREEELVPM